MSGVVYVAVGGADEIGMNMYLYGWGEGRDRKWIVVDCGIAFGDPDRTPGVETMSPDPVFLAETGQSVEAIFITHGHLDHLGALGDLWPRLGKPPIYATTFAAEVAREVMSESAGGEAASITVVADSAPVQAGPFTVGFHRVVHSIPDSALLSIRTPEGLIVHSGDFRTPAPAGSGEEAVLRAFGDEGVICLNCESTNIFEPGDDRFEEDLLPRLIEVIGGCDGAVAATTFASNVHRLRTLARAGNACGRRIIVVGRSMRRMLEIAGRTGVAEGMPEWSTEVDNAGNRAELLYLVTGSQGEPRSALARVAEGSHPELRLVPGDTVLLSSSIIPGNERAVHRVLNALAIQGVEAVEGEAEGLHVSGHAGHLGLRRLYELLRPRAAVPIHGEPRHLRRHAMLAREWGAARTLIARNGVPVRIEADALTAGTPLACRRLYREGKLLLPEGQGVIRERRRMSDAGHVAVSIVFDERGVLLVPPRVETRGAPGAETEFGEGLAEAIENAAERALETLSRRGRLEEESVIVAIRRAVNRVARDRWGKRPEITVMPSYLE